MSAYCGPSPLRASASAASASTRACSRPAVEPFEFGGDGLGGDVPVGEPLPVRVDDHRRADRDTRADGDPAQGLHRFGFGLVRPAAAARPGGRPRPAGLGGAHGGASRSGGRPRPRGTAPRPGSASASTAAVGVGAVRLQVEPGAALGGQQRQVEDALAVDLFAIMVDPDLGLELAGQLHELRGRAQVQAVLVGDLDLSAGDGRVVAHRRLGRPEGERPGARGRRSVSGRSSRLVSFHPRVRRGATRRASRASDGGTSRGAPAPADRLDRPAVGRTARRPRPTARRSGRAVVGLLEQFDDLLARLRLPQEADEPLVLQVPGDVLQRPEVVAGLVRAARSAGRRCPPARRPARRNRPRGATAPRCRSGGRRSGAGCAARRPPGRSRSTRAPRGRGSPARRSPGRRRPACRRGSGCRRSHGSRLPYRSPARSTRMASRTTKSESFIRPSIGYRPADGPAPAPRPGLQGGAPGPPARRRGSAGGGARYVSVQSG